MSGSRTRRPLTWSPERFTDCPGTSSLTQSWSSLGPVAQTSSSTIPYPNHRICSSDFLIPSGHESRTSSPTNSIWSNLRWRLLKSLILIPGSVAQNSWSRQDMNLWRRLPQTLIQSQDMNLRWRLLKSLILIPGSVVQSSRSQFQDTNLRRCPLQSLIPKTGSVAQRSWSQSQDTNLRCYLLQSLIPTPGHWTQIF